jgi:hypothetical protein
MKSFIEINPKRRGTKLACWSRMNTPRALKLERKATRRIKIVFIDAK